MRHVSFLSLLFFFSFGVCFAGSTPIADSVQRTLSNFHAITVQGSYIVYITQAADESVRVDAPAEIASRIVTEVKNGVLIIRNRHDNWLLGPGSWYSGKSWWHHHDKIIVYVNTRQLSEIKTAGSANVYFKDGLTTDNMLVRVLGSGTIEGQLNAAIATTRLTGSARVKLTGKINDLTVSISGSSNLDAMNLLSVHVALHILGSGHASIYASESIRAALYGSSSLDYAGAAQLSSKKVGSAAISKRNS